MGFAETFKALSDSVRRDILMLLREGRICMVPASKVVPGDILVLETGGIAAADGRILQATGLTCNESSLTGEALNVEKNEKSLFSQQEDIALGDQSNMVFSGAGQSLKWHLIKGPKKSPGHFPDLL